MTKFGKSSLFLAMFNSYSIISYQLTSSEGLFSMGSPIGNDCGSQSAAVFFATHGLWSLAKEEAWRPQTGRVPGTVWWKLCFFRHPKATKRYQKHQQNIKKTIEFRPWKNLVFTWVFPIFHGDIFMDSMEFPYELDTGFRLRPADLDWWYSTPLEYGFQGGTLQHPWSILPRWISVDLLVI